MKKLSLNWGLTLSDQGGLRTSLTKLPRACCCHAVAELMFPYAVRWWPNCVRPSQPSPCAAKCRYSIVRQWAAPKDDGPSLPSRGPRQTGANGLDLSRTSMPEYEPLLFTVTKRGSCGLLVKLVSRPCGVLSANHVCCITLQMMIRYL